MGNYIANLSKLEKKLLETQDVFTVRGKKGRPVPIIIPLDLGPVMQLLMDKVMRTQIGVDKSPYVFANLKSPETNVFKAGESLDKVVEVLSLERPELIKSTILRKYIATMIQVLSLDRTQMEWVADHLGHSFDVEKVYYRMTSSTIERAKVAKLLILADAGNIDNFKGKKLDELTFEEIPLVNDESDEEEPVETGSMTSPDSSAKKSAVHFKQNLRRRRTKEQSDDSDGSTWEPDLKQRYTESEDSNDDVAETSTSSTEWTAKRRSAYDQVFCPVISEKMLRKQEIIDLKMQHVELKYFSYAKLKNKINADVQKAKRKLRKLEKL